ncbi:GNAT family N-acetyltransferase [Thalassospira sp. TSL5-1]|uniref:GNAT family N-acetyltransferase n=1 Tax=Thalassospira sp. TSL5-1 TaxID=1544451 RepID=UPI000AFA733E|nr:GNAT family N-acetyltransferase [Thalassospira sp. TSL5-1]
MPDTQEMLPSCQSAGCIISDIDSPNTRHGTIKIRDAVTSDIPAIHRIYRQAVEEGTASFEEITPNETELAHRLAALLEKGYPYLAAIDGETGQLCGYAYAGPYRPRSAYRHTVEDSIYVAPEYHGKGIGSLLLHHLIMRCEAGPWRQMIAAVGDSANKGSLALHRKHGFVITGTFYNVGYKFGRWLDSVLMQRPLHSAAPLIPAATLPLETPSTK